VALGTAKAAARRREQFVTPERRAAALELIDRLQRAVIGINAVPGSPVQLPFEASEETRLGGLAAGGPGYERVHKFAQIMRRIRELTFMTKDGTATYADYSEINALHLQAASELEAAHRTISAIG
jgi:hypothetical protein